MRVKQYIGQRSLLLFPLLYLTLLGISAIPLHPVFGKLLCPTVTSKQSCMPQLILTAPYLGLMFAPAVFLKIMFNIISISLPNLENISVPLLIFMNTMLIFLLGAFKDYVKALKK